MKEVEVSAIKEAHDYRLACAISPCGRFFYNFDPQCGWYEWGDSEVNVMSSFNSSGGYVHRGIFRIKVVED